MEDAQAEYGLLFLGGSTTALGLEVGEYCLLWAQSLSMLPAWAVKYINVTYFGPGLHALAAWVTSELGNGGWNREQRYALTFCLRVAASMPLSTRERTSP